MEQLIFLIVIGGLYLLQAWWKGKADKEQTEAPPPWPGQQPPPGPGPSQRPPVQPAPPPAARWEEELRRLLEGGSPKPTPPPVATVPPPLPPKLPRKPVAPKPIVVVDRDMETGLQVRMPTLEKSAQAFLRASQLESKVAEHMQRVSEQVTTHKKIEVRRGTSPEIRQAIGLVRHRQSQRAAIIAGIVLGPPKAMEG
jgi:hypothetical protein